MSQIRTSLARLARNGSAVAISLDNLKTLADKRWDAIAEATVATLERLMRLKLGHSDHYVQLGPLDWLVVMPGTAIEDALSCCVRISYDVQVSAFQSCEVEQLKIARAAVISDDVIELVPLTPDQMRAAASRAAIAAPPEKAAETVEPHAPSGDTTGAVPQAQGAPKRFEPIWDATRQAVASFHCVPHSGAGANEPVVAHLHHTQALLENAVSALESHIAQGLRCILFVTIPYDVLSAPPARMELLATCREMPCSVRPFLVFDIATLATGIPKHRLIEIVSAIRPFARAVVARVDPRNAALLDYGGAGLAALGLNLTGTQSDAVNAARLVTATKRLGMAAYLGNVTSATLLEQSVRGGVQWFWGPAIGTQVNKLGPPSRLTLQTILENWDRPVRNMA